MPPNVAHLLTRQSHRRPDTPKVTFAGDLGLDLSRTHELCGTARRTLALTIARATTGPVLWIRPDWTAERLNPDAMRRFVDPSRLLFLDARRAEDLLWSMEEVLRSGQIALTIADLPAPPGLTAVRRLHLAAETGATEGPLAPLGVLLTPGDGGAPGVETRWGMTPDHGTGGLEAWRLERLRARSAPPKSWRMEWDSDGPKLAA